MAKGDRYVTCPRCGGMGIIQRTTRGGIISTTCPKCGGAGRVKAGCAFTLLFVEVLNLPDDCTVMMLLRLARKTMPDELIAEYSKYSEVVYENLSKFTLFEQRLIAMACWDEVINILHILDSQSSEAAILRYRRMFDVLTRYVSCSNRYVAK